MHSTAFGSCLLPIIRLKESRQRSAFCKTSRLFAAQRFTAVKPEHAGSSSCHKGSSESRAIWLGTAPHHARTATTHSRTTCSAADSSQDFTTAASSSNDARQASNAAASTSSSQPATTPDDATPAARQNRNLFLAVRSMLLAVFQSIARLFKGLPAFVQREKLQRLHKRALDNPTDADR